MAAPQLFHFMKVLMELKDLTKSMTDLIKVAATSWLGICISALVLVLLTVVIVGVAWSPMMEIREQAESEIQKNARIQESFNLAFATHTPTKTPESQDTSTKAPKSQAGDESVSAQQFFKQAEFYREQTSLNALRIANH
jgi:hypothetical protein